MLPPSFVRKHWLFFVGLNAPAFSLSLMHVVNNPNIYHYVLTSFVERGLLVSNRFNTALGLLSILGLLMASIAQPLIGAISDRARTPWGQRYPFLFGGALAFMLSALWLVNVSAWWMLIVALLCVQVALNTIQSPLQALIPDYVNPQQMGLASSIKTTLELAGIIASGAVVLLFLGVNTRPELAVLAATGLLMVALLITLRTAPYPRQRYQERAKRATLAQRYIRLHEKRRGGRPWALFHLLRQTLRHILRERPLQWWLIGRFFFYCAFNTISKFAISYMTDVFGYSGGEARAIQGIVLTSTGVLIVVATLGAGLLADRLGRKRLATLGASLAALCAAIMILAPSFPLAVVLICITGVGCGIFFSAGWALITYIIPSRQAGFYLGFMNLATTLGGAFGMLGGYLVDVVNDLASNPVTGYSILFAICATFFLLGAFAIGRVPDRQLRPRAISHMN